MPIKFLNDVAVDSSVLYVDTINNRVGIGTSSPGSILSISDNEPVVEIAAANRGSDGQSNATLSLESKARDSGTNRYSRYNIVVDPADNFGNASLTFNYLNDGTDYGERMRITSAGNVGIGNTSPAARLDIGDNTLNAVQTILARGQDPGFQIRTINAEGNNTNSVVGRIAGTYNNTISSGIKFKRTAGTSSYLAFSTGDDTDRMTISETGNVGIGTTSPSSPLMFGKSVYGNFDSENFYRIKLQDQGGTHNDVGIGQTASGNMGFNITSGSAFIFNNGTSGEIARFDGTGLGIGTTSPTEKLHVAGNLRVTGAYYDSTNSPGTSGQILSSTATGTDWIDGSAIPGVPDGSGTAGKIVMWQDSDTLTDSKITQTAGIEPNYVDVDFANVEDLTITGDSSFSTFTVSGFDAVNFTSIENNFNVGSGDLAIATNDNSMNLGGGAADSDTLTVGYTTTRFIGTGNVGIGTTSPYTKFEVVGKGSFGSSGASNLGVEISSVSAIPSAQVKGYIAQATSSAGGGNGDLLIASRTSAATNIRFFAGSTSEKMRIDSSGNVGIGTTSPQEKLHVQNYTTGESHQAMFKGGAVTVGDYSYISLNNGYGTEYNKEVRLAAVAELSTSNKTGFAILTSPDANGASGHERLRVTADGNVGIGTTSPGQKLSVAPNTDASAEIGEAHIGLVGYSGYAGFSHVDQNTNAQGYALLQYSDGSTYVNANTGKDVRFRIANSDKMILNSLGNVGIGDTGPDAKLTVFRTDSTYAVNLSDTESKAGLSVKSSSTFDSKLTISSGASSRQYIQAVNNAATTGRDIAINPYGGNVGIGTSSPGSKLHVSGGDIKLDDGYEVKFNINGTVTADEELVLDAGTTDSKIILDGSDSAMQFITGNSTAIAINDAQNVGIGTTSPQSKLQVNGGVQLANDTAAASASKVGTFKYYTSGNNSYVDMCMQTGATTYAWVNIVQNSW